MTKQTKMNNLNYLIDLTFTKFNRSFALSFENGDDLCRDGDYTIGNLLDYEYFSKHYNLIAVDLSKQIELENSDLRQQINFIGEFEENKATVFFIIEKSEETTF